MSADGIDNMDAFVKALQRKLNTAVDRIDELERENNELRRQVSELQAELNPDPESKSYDELSKGDKVRRIREKLVDVAETNHGGCESLKYKEIKMLFGGYPSPGHCYDLMQVAGEAEGFAYDENGDGTKRVRVDIEAVKDESYFHTANKPVEA